MLMKSLLWLSSIPGEQDVLSTQCAACTEAVFTARRVKKEIQAEAWSKHNEPKAWG